ncbi:hypothetical protein, partial [uncultured Campylobacter sp.]|uniref:hypothetical protein n=1 Tax=uncultured Campylobacter sp. TaxID=218934 RepID=UPI002631DC66
QEPCATIKALNLNIRTYAKILKFQICARVFDRCIARAVFEPPQNGLRLQKRAKSRKLKYQRCGDVFAVVTQK